MIVAQLHDPKTGKRWKHRLSRPPTAEELETWTEQGLEVDVTSEDRMAAKKAKKKTKAATNVTAGDNPAIVPAAKDPNHREKLGKPHTKEVAVTGSAQEFEACAGELVALLEEEAKIKDQRRDAMAGFRQKLAGVDDRKLKLSGALKSHRVLRPVVVQEYLLADNRIEVCRADTGEVVERRTAEAKDLQPELFAGDKGDPEDDGEE